MIDRYSVFGHRIGALELEADPNDPRVQAWLRKRSLVLSADRANRDAACPSVTAAPRTVMMRAWSETRELPATVFSPAGEAGCTRGALLDCFAITRLQKQGGLGTDRICVHERFGSISSPARIQRIDTEVAESLSAVPSRDALRRWGSPGARIPLSKKPDGRPDSKKDFRRRRLVEILSAPPALRLGVVLSSNFVMDRRGLKKAVVVPLDPTHASKGPGTIEIPRGPSTAAYEIRAEHVSCLDLSQLRATGESCPPEGMSKVLARVLECLGIQPVPEAP